MAYNYWDSAYASGHVPWDPGPYDRHLPGLIAQHGIEPCNALDIGCGNGKSLIWLAERGYRGTGIEIAPTALKQAEAAAKSHGVTCRWLFGSFPEDFGADVLADGEFSFIMDRGWFHLFTGRHEQQRIVDAIARLLRSGGLWYSLIAANAGGRGYGGPPRWSESEVRRALAAPRSPETPTLEVDTLELSVFTPGEPGSMASWVLVARRP